MREEVRESSTRDHSRMKRVVEVVTVAFWASAALMTVFGSALLGRPRGAEPMVLQPTGRHVCGISFGFVGVLLLARAPHQPATAARRSAGESRHLGGRGQRVDP